METTKPARKPKQEKIPGFTEIEDDEVEALAEQYKAETDEWLAKQKIALETEGKLLAAAKKNKALIAAAKAHKKGYVKVGDVRLQIRAKDPSLKIKVKILGEVEEGAAPEKEESEAAE